MHRIHERLAARYLPVYPRRFSDDDIIGILNSVYTDIAPQYGTLEIVMASLISHPGRDTGLSDVFRFIRRFLMNHIMVKLTCRFPEELMYSSSYVRICMCRTVQDPFRMPVDPGKYSERVFICCLPHVFGHLLFLLLAILLFYYWLFTIGLTNVFAERVWVPVCCLGAHSMFESEFLEDVCAADRDRGHVEWARGWCSVGRGMVPFYAASKIMETMLFRASMAAWSNPRKWRSLTNRVLAKSALVRPPPPRRPSIFEGRRKRGRTESIDTKYELLEKAKRGAPECMKTLLDLSSRSTRLDDNERMAVARWLAYFGPSYEVFLDAFKMFVEVEPGVSFDAGRDGLDGETYYKSKLLYDSTFIPRERDRRHYRTYNLSCAFIRTPGRSTAKSCPFSTTSGCMSKCGSRKPRKLCMDPTKWTPQRARKMILYNGGGGRSSKRSLFKHRKMRYTS
jgi:hypothetical protein